MDQLENIKANEIILFSNVQRYKNANPTFIPLYLTGGIGDVIMAMDAVEFLASKYQIIVYTHHLEAFKYFNDKIPAFKVLPEFTWYLEFNTTARFHFRDGFHGFAISAHDDLFMQQARAFDDDMLLESIVKTHDRKFFLISNYAQGLGIDRRDFPLHALGFKDRIRFSCAEKSPVRSKTITIHDGFDIHNRSIVQGRATKQWDWRHWCALAKMLKNKFPAYDIVQLGTSHTSRVIDGVDACLIDKTTITEAFGVLSRSSLHIDGDSGLVHAATKMKTPCVVMWGPTPDLFYGYMQNDNVRSTACSGGCYGVKIDWNDKCPIGNPAPVCMDEIRPEMIMERVNGLLT